jgi:transcriptional regulator with XRE-family HTH domain
MSNRPDPVDIYVGGRIRQRRNLLGMSQDKLAGNLGVTFQQVQKYENGVNRVGASRLFQVAKTLGVPVAYFFDGFQGTVHEVSPMVAEQNAQIGDDILNRKETLDLVRAYYSIKDERIRRKMLDVLRSAGSDD